METIPVIDVPAAGLVEAVERLRAEGYALFLDVTAVDRTPREPRFDVVYHFLRPRPRPVARIRLVVKVTEAEPVVPTLTHLFNSARFMERECHDMYGIRFDGNADLRPILLYEGFEGHPLRKDYPIDREQPIVPYRT